MSYIHKDPGAFHEALRKRAYTQSIILHHTQNEHVRMKEKVAKKWKLLKILLPDSHKVCKDLGGEKPGCCTELSFSRHVGRDRRNVYETAPRNAPSL